MKSHESIWKISKSWTGVRYDIEAGNLSEKFYQKRRGCAIAALALSAVMAVSGCRTIPKFDRVESKNKIENARYVIKIEHGGAHAAAEDLRRVVGDLIVQVPWADSMLRKHNMSFVFSSGDSLGKSLGGYSSDRPDIISINPDFRHLLDGASSAFEALIYGDQDYGIKKTILHELIHKDQDVRGVMKLVENLKPSDYCLAANFMEIDPDLKAEFMLNPVDQKLRDSMMIFKCDEWGEYDSYTTRNLFRSLFNRPDGCKPTVEECFSAAAKCGPADTGYSAAAVSRAVDLVTENTWGESSYLRGMLFSIKSWDDGFFRKYPEYAAANQKSGRSR